MYIIYVCVHGIIIADEDREGISVTVVVIVVVPKYLYITQI